MSFIIEELVARISYIHDNQLIIHAPKNAFARSRYETRGNQPQGKREYGKVYVSHGPTVATPSSSIPCRWYLRETTWRSHHDGLHKRCCGLSMGPGRKATSGVFLAGDHLR